MMGEPRIRLVDLTIRLPKGQVLVDRLSLNASAGEIVAIVGRSGIGKSTLLNVIAGFVRREGGGPQSPWQWLGGGAEPNYDGTVLVDEVAIDSVPPERRGAIGMVMQGAFVYEHLSPLENLTFAMRTLGATRSTRRQEAVRLLAEVELLNELPRQALDQPARHLSGGQRQRLALARLLAKRASVFLLDEAFANLDPLLRLDLFEKFAGMVRGTERCALVVTHDLSDLIKVQRILLLGSAEQGAGHCSFRREGAKLVLEEDRSDGSTYWSNWQARLSAAVASTTAD